MKAKLWSINWVINYLVYLWGIPLEVSVTIPQRIRTQGVWMWGPSGGDLCHSTDLIWLSGQVPPLALTSPYDRSYSFIHWESTQKKWCIHTHISLPSLCNRFLLEYKQTSTKNEQNIIHIIQIKHGSVCQHSLCSSKIFFLNYVSSKENIATSRKKSKSISESPKSQHIFIV